MALVGGYTKRIEKIISAAPRYFAYSSTPTLLKESTICLDPENLNTPLAITSRAGMMVTITDQVEFNCMVIFCLKSKATYLWFPKDTTIPKDTSILWDTTKFEFYVR